MRKKPAKRVHYIDVAKTPVNLDEVVRRIRADLEYVILEKDGAPIAGIMDGDELEDYLEVRDPKVQAQIARSNKDYLAGKSRPVEEFLAELRNKGRKQASARQRRRA